MSIYEHTLTHTSLHAHTNKQLNELPNYYKIALIRENKANLGATCGTPMEAPTEASGAAEGTLDRESRREGRGCVRARARRRRSTAIHGEPEKDIPCTI